MLRVVMSRLRLQWTRYLAVVACVAVCAGFMTSALGLSGSLKASFAAQLVAPYKNADAVAAAQASPVRVSAQQLRSIEAMDGVRSAWAPQQRVVTAQGTELREREATRALETMPADTSLIPSQLTQGEWPAAPDEVVMNQELAEKAGVSVGDTVTLSQLSFGEGPEAQPEPGRQVSYTVSALMDSQDATGLADWYVTQDGADRLGPQPPPREGAQAVLLRTEGTLNDSQLGALQSKIRDLLGSGRGDQPVVDVKSVDAMTKDAVDDLSSGVDVLGLFFAIFAGLAALVALLVVTNTLSVLTAQRARELALLRCVGATRSQVRRAVTVEAAVLGVIASALGVGFVWGLVQVLRLTGLTGGLELVVPWSSVLTGFVVGVVLTLLASIAPARRAHGAAPLDGLRGSRAADGVPKLRMIAGALILLAGAVTLGIGAVQHQAGLGVIGGLAGFLGVVMISRLYLPPLVGALGKALPGGLPARVAAANALRYPARTTTTATALLIGVLLVATVLTGQQTVRTSMLTELDRERPVDISAPASAGSVSDDQLQQLRDLGGVDGVQRGSGEDAVVIDTGHMGLGPAEDLRQKVADVLKIQVDQLGGSLMEKASYVSLLDIMLGVVLGLLAAAVVVAVLGIASTTSLSVLERVRENSLMRALGLSRRQLGAMIRREALLISLGATLVGLLVGWIFGTAGIMSIVPEGIPVTPVVPWTGYALILLGAVLVAVLASALPVRRATRVTPVQGMARVD